MKWSVHGQTPLYLAMSRMATLGPAVMEQVLSRLPLTPGMRVLDVGCGSGEFTFRLAQHVQDAHFTGVDYDQGFVDCCNARVAGKDVGPLTPAPAGNRYAFLQADGMALPFANATFDLVVGHTYLTALPDYYGALQEMMRVCKPGGLVASISSMGDAYDRFGCMDLLPRVLPAADAALVDRVRARIRQADPAMNMRSGVPKGKVQLTFSRVGLEQVSTLPLAQYLSLSDANLPAAEYHRYVDLLHAVEVESAQATRALDLQQAEQQALTEQDWTAYLELLERRRVQLHDLQGRNAEWTWHGSAAILVTGRVPQKAAPTGLARCLQSEPWAVQEAALLARFAQSTGLAQEQSTIQTACGRACAVKLQGPGADPVWGAGFTPAQASAHAHALLLEQAAQCSAEQECNKSPDEGAPGYSAVRLASSRQLACVEAASAALEAFAREHLGAACPPPAHDQQVYGVLGVYETAYDAIALGYGVQFLDASLGLGIPAIACHVTGNGRQSWGLASYPSLSIAAQRACARALAFLADAPQLDLGVLPQTNDAPQWEAPLWVEDPQGPEEALHLLDLTFQYLGWTAEYADVTPAQLAANAADQGESTHGTDSPALHAVRCTIRP